MVDSNQKTRRCAFSAGNIRNPRRCTGAGMGPSIYLPVISNNNWRSFLWQKSEFLRFSWLWQCVSVWLCRHSPRLGLRLVGFIAIFPVHPVLILIWKAKEKPIIIGMSPALALPPLWIRTDIFVSALLMTDTKSIVVKEMLQVMLDICWICIDRISTATSSVRQTPTRILMILSLHAQELWIALKSIPHIGVLSIAWLPVATPVNFTGAVQALFNGQKSKG